MKANEFFEPMLLFIKTVDNDGNAKIQKLFFPTFIPKGNDRTDTFEYPAPEIDGYIAPSSTLTMTFYEPNIVNKTEYDYDGVWSCFKPNLTTSPVSVADENTLPVYTRKSGDTGTVRDAWYTDTGYPNGMGCGGLIYGASFTPYETNNDNIYYNPIIRSDNSSFDWNFGGYKHSFIPFCGKAGVRYTYTIPEDFWLNLGYSLTETTFDWEFESVNNDFYFVPTVYKHGTDEKIWIEQGVMNSDDEDKDEKLSRDVNTVFAYAGELPKIMDFPKTIEVNTDGLSGRFYGTVSVPFALPGTATTIDMPSLENYKSNNPLASDNAGNYNRQTVVMDKIDKEDVDNDFMGCTVNGWVNDILSESTLPTDKAHYDTSLNITDNSQDIMWAAVQSYGILIDNEYYNYNVMFLSKNGEKKQLSELPPIPGISFIADNSQDPALPYTYEIDAALDEDGYPTDPFMGDFVISEDDTPIPYPGAIGNGELVILSSNPEYNKYINGRLDPSGRVFDKLGIRVISDIVSDDGKREVTVTTTRGDYMPSPYDVLVRNTSVGLMLGDLVPKPGMMSWSSMSPFAPYLGYFHQDFPLFLESYADGKYTFVNLFALKLKYLRPVDSDGSQTYHWIKKCYDDFLKTHSFMLCYYLGATNKGKNYLSFYEKSPGDGTDWGGAPVVNDSLAVATVSDVLQQSIQTEAHGFMLQEGFMLTDDGQPWYFGTVYYDYTKTSDPNDGEDFEKRSISYINLQNEHILQYSHNGRDFSENPRIIRIWQSNADSTSATDRGYYGIDENAKVKHITDMKSLKAPQYSVSDVLISADETIDATVFGQIKYALNNRDVDMSVVIDLANRYSSTMMSTWRQDSWTPSASFSNYSGWIQCDFSDEGTPPVILQFKQMDFIAQTMLLATNNDILLKERV